MHDSSDLPPHSMTPGTDTTPMGPKIGITHGEAGSLDHLWYWLQEGYQSVRFAIWLFEDALVLAFPETIGLITTLT